MARSVIRGKPTLPSQMSFEFALRDDPALFSFTLAQKSASSTLVGEVNVSTSSAVTDGPVKVTSDALASLAAFAKDPRLAFVYIRDEEGRFVRGRLRKPAKCRQMVL